jgi:hypothetical protein
VDEKKGLSSLGKSTCAVKKKSAHLFNQRIIKALPRLVHFTASSPNESIWNVMGIYRDKTVHYKYYDVLYKMGYLDWNENRLRKVGYKHKTIVRDWKIRHNKRIGNMRLFNEFFRLEKNGLTRIPLLKYLLSNIYERGKERTLEAVKKTTPLLNA